jgi:hypothetical protein
MIRHHPKMFTIICNRIALVMLGTIIHLLTSCTGMQRLESVIPHDKKWKDGVQIPSGNISISSYGTQRSFPPSINSGEPLALSFGVSTDYPGCVYSFEDIRVNYADRTVITLNPVKIDTGILMIGGVTTEYKIVAPKSEDKRIVLSFRLRQLEGRHSFTRNYSVPMRYDKTFKKVKYNPFLDPS